jgi:hypothetical protein
MARIDIGQNIMKPQVVPATAEGFLQAADDRKTGRICAELADLLEQKQRGELTEDEYGEAKNQKKRGCRFYTPHAHFNNGYKRSDGDPVDSGKAVIDLDGCADFTQRYEQYLKGREKELGINMVNISVSSTGGHVLFDIPVGLSREEAQQWMSHIMGDVAYDKAVHDLERAIYIPCREYILYIDEEMMFSDNLQPAVLTEAEMSEVRGKMADVKAEKEVSPKGGDLEGASHDEAASSASLTAFDLCVQQAGLNAEALDVYGQHNWHTNLMAVLSVGVGKLMSRQQLKAVVAVRMPNYSATKDCQNLIDYFYDKYDADKGFMNTTLREINAKSQESALNGECSMVNGQLSMSEEDEQLSILNSQLSIKKLPQGIRESIDAVGPHLAMPVLTAICPCIGALATGVTLDVHGQKKGLNLIAYIAGDFASGKGGIDPVVEAWMSEVRALDKMYQMQEDEWRAKKQAAKNKKEQPEQPKLPVRFLPLNNTVANLAERLANTEGKHAFSFTPEADTVAQKWKSSMSDFSVMLRQSYDGSRYDREAKSADAVNVHIEHLLWNVTMCGTPDALYRVVSNYTDGFQSRIAVARTPDNTFAQLEEKPFVLTDQQQEQIRQIAHLLPLMQGEVELPKLEAKGREWLENIRLETMMNDDRIRARQRIRACVTAQRMTCCLMLCKVAEGLIQKHGFNGAEKLLKTSVDIWKAMLQKAQTPQMLEAYDVIADYLLETALYFFRDRIENAFRSRDYAGGSNSERVKRGKNDTIFDRLDVQFSFDQAMQHSVAIKGADVTRNSVTQMLKNWKKQGLVEQTDTGRFRKVADSCH